MPPFHRPDPFAPISPNVITTRQPRASAKPQSDIHAYGSENVMEGRAHQDDVTVQSEASNLTSLDEQTTDDFGKLLIQHARDERRLQDALQGKARPFSKARPRQRARLTLADLERSLIEKGNSFEQRRMEREDSILSFASPPDSVSSVESRESEPSLNIPKGWGRKARKGTDWLRRSLDRQDNVEEESVERRPTAFANDGTPRAIDWANAASEVPLPAMEDSPSVLRYARGTPPSIQKRDEAAARARQWDIDEEFTSMSIIASTPALPRNTRLDDIKLRELETVTEVSGVDDSRNHSPEPVSSPVQRSALRSAERRKQRTTEQTPSTSWSHPAEQPLHLPKREQDQRQSEPDKLNSAPQAVTKEDESSPVRVYKSTETPEPVKERPEQHRRQDSHDLLRRLARAASNSPSPGRPVTKSEKPETRRKAEPVPSSKDAPSVDEQTRNLSTQTSTNDAVGEEKNRKADRQTEEAAADMEAIDPHTPMPGELLGPDNRQALRHSKTPIVTGAWVDTPAPTVERRLSLSPRKSCFSPKKTGLRDQTASQSPEKRARSHRFLPTPEPSKSPERHQSPQKPTLPTSALAAVLGDAKAHPDNADDGLPYDRELDHLGESTINSLEDLVDTSLAVPLNDDTMTLDLPSLPPPDAKPKNAAERQRWKEMEQVSRMNKQLRDARHNIRDARVGLRRFENAMMSGDNDEKCTAQGTPEGCDACGCPGGARYLDIHSIRQSVTYAFITPQATASVEVDAQAGRKYVWPWRWRLTWLGLILFSLLAYTTLETTLCAQYCQPRYASSMHGYGVDPYAPRLPFVTPTILLRPLKPVVQPLWRTVRINGELALREYGILGEQPQEHLPWLKGRPTLSPSEKHAWEGMLAAAKQTAAPDVTRWAQRIATAMGEPASTAVRWAHTAATAAGAMWTDDEEVMGMGADEVL